jgi:hypothetical protein
MGRDLWMWFWWGRNPSRREYGFTVKVKENGRLPPQTIPHPIDDETVERMGHPDLWRHLAG